MSPIESNVAIEFENGRIRLVTVNGSKLTVLRGGIDLDIEEGGFTTLRVALPVLEGGFRGAVRVEVSNALPGCTFQRDDQGRVWIVPAKAAEEAAA